ncbi:type II secretion system minor pseudopilin GspJ [Psychrobacter sp. APC 3279]|uniref:type II secretion system minor pseudopilin GspJ n=1 Tax=Psychrobacter sp. APC 3279 TaxID=3035189 RepID=UPI0025B314F3|nr:type II secretion system minor pseudopilin GspJ [Psychrobacter sp. APC 3279]MDN3440638.1 type II secretion system minor pseudopilin GspJ [Psychrobacter sp. APC 3279]
MRHQRGFTLLELMVAMAIFAMLAVAGWQVFDGVNRARERAQFHADNLAVLQYAYLQLQQDMGQIIPYQAATQSVSAANNNTSNSTSSGNNTQSSEQINEIAPEPFMSLDGEHISFIRFADPDPRYQNSNSLQRIEYIFADERLIRRQYTSMEGGRDSVSLDSVLLEGVTAGSWQAYLPELSTKFPSDDANSGSSTNKAVRQSANTASPKPTSFLLPKGVAVSFTYQDMPITWQWALAPQPIPRSSAKAANSNGNSNNDNSSDNNNGSDSSNSNSSADDSNVGTNN